MRISRGYSTCRWTKGIMTDKSIWNKPIPVPASVISYVDDAVLQRKEAIRRLSHQAVETYRSWLI